MNNAVKEFAVKTNAARMKELLLNLRISTYLMATLTISSKNAVRTPGCPLIDNKHYKTSVTPACF